jgi:peptidylprolyl isomerase
VLRGSRPSAALVASLVVLTGALAACGDSTPGTGLDFGDRLEAATVTGDIGAAKIEWKERMEAGALESETLVEGEGEALAKDDEVFVNYAFGNGYTRQTTIDSFGEEAAGFEMTVGAEENAEPASIDDVLSNVLREYVTEGTTKGTRIAVTGDTPAFFPTAETTQLGQLLAVEGIGNEDGLLMVVDVMDVEVLDGPEGEPGKSPGWAPRITATDGVPTALDFSRVDAPDPKAKLLFSVLQEGTGPEVEKGDLVVADYLGQIQSAKKPFDESYSKDKEPLQTGIGLSQVIEGWDEVIVGQKVGSRVIMRIPPAKAYADQEQPNIPKNSTLYFVIDILAAV